jgi:hypothetical protein
MTQKELLYLEDAIGHEQNMAKIIEDAISTLENEKLIDFMKKELKMHNDLESKLIEFMEGSC